MKKELEEQLVKKYPKIMKNYCGDPKKTCFAFGFENDNGWYDLIDNLCFSIQSHIDYFPHKIEQVVIDQVKEKFSTLRFYYTGGDEFIKGVVSLAKEMSSLFCEFCGTNQNVNRITHVRIKTICKICEKGWRKR